MAVDRETLVRLLTSEQRKLRAYCWVITRDDHIVEEVVQDMAVIALQKCDQIQDANHFPAWARITCRNLAMNALRKKTRQPLTLSSGTLDLLEAHWEKLDGTESADLMEALRKCVGHLTSRVLQILRFRYAEGLRPAEIADRLGMNPSTLYVTLLRAHQTLAKCIDNELKKR